MVSLGKEGDGYETTWQIKMGDDERKNNRCSVCKKELEYGEVVYYCGYCKKVFHKNCVWIGQTLDNKAWPCDHTRTARFNYEYFCGKLDMG